MIHLAPNHPDAAKIETWVIQALERLSQAEVHKNGVVRLKQLYVHLKVASLRLQHLADEINDVLSATTVVHRFGFWVFTELEGNTWTLVRVSAQTQRDAMGPDRWEEFDDLIALDA